MNVNGNVFTLKDEEFGLKVGLFGHDTKTTSHSHDFIEFSFIEQGFTMHRVEGEKTSLLLPGDILFVLPGMAHEYWKSTNNKVFNCLFYPEVLGEDLNALIQLPMLKWVLKADSGVRWGKTHLKADSRYAISELSKKLQVEGSARLLGWKIRSKALLIDYLISLSRVWGKEKYSDVINDSYIKENDADYLPTPSGIMRLLEASEKKRMSVEDMAATIGYSPEHFSRVFKKLTGISPLAYLTNMRVAAAAEKLLDERLSVAEVAEMTGFEDVNYFSRIFKKETGKTPSEFRASKF